jgi:hypothetical protein
MKITNHVAIAALLSCSMMTPAMASVPEPTSTALTAMQSACDLAKPADQQVTTGSDRNPVVENISYTANVVNVVGTALAPRVETADPVFLRAGSSTPLSVGSPVYESGSEVRRGGSPNIHGDFVATAIYEGAVYTQLTTTYDRTSFAFTCSFNKITPGTTIVGWKTADSASPHVEEAAVGKETNPEIRGPNVEGKFYSDGVICISPGDKRGTWRVQNGYTGGKCNGTNAVVTAYYLSLDAKFARSNSVPTYTPPLGNYGNSGDSISGSAFVNPVTDTDPDTISSTTTEDAPVSGE